MTQTQPQIRPAKPQDNIALLELFKAHALHEGHDLNIADQLKCLSDPKSHPLTLFVVDHNSQLHGYMSLVKQYSSWDMAWYLYLDCLYLAPTLRGLGLGQQLMQIAAEHARQSGISQLQWQTPVDNFDAIGFYQKLGAENKQKQRFFWSVS